MNELCTCVRTCSKVKVEQLFAAEAAESLQESAPPRCHTMTPLCQNAVFRVGAST